MYAPYGPPATRLLSLGDAESSEMQARTTIRVQTYNWQGGITVHGDRFSRVTD